MMLKSNFSRVDCDQNYLKTFPKKIKLGVVPLTTVSPKAPSVELPARMEANSMSFKWWTGSTDSNML